MYTSATNKHYFIFLNFTHPTAPTHIHNCPHSPHPSALSIFSIALLNFYLLHNLIYTSILFYIMLTTLLILCIIKETPVRCLLICWLLWSYLLMCSIYQFIKSLLYVSFLCFINNSLGISK